MHKIPFFLNAFVKLIQCHEVPGKYRFYEVTKDKYKRRLITYSIKDCEFSIPWDQWCFWNNYGPENYYLEEILPFTKILDKYLVKFDFFDLGADVGVVSALINKHCDGLQNIIALEPNPIAFGVLEKNLNNISSQHKAYHQAISDFKGYALFNYNMERGSDHEGHLVIEEREQALKSSSKVTTLDDLVADNNLKIHQNIALKIDVEGQEKAMLKGGRRIITNADKVVLLLELHPEVLARDNQTPEDILNEAEKLRSFKWIVPIQENRRIDRTRNFYDQFPLQQYDIIGISD